MAHLALKDLKISTEVCRRFESVVASSPVLMNKFKVCWVASSFERPNVNLILASSRKYRRVSFEFREMQQNIIMAIIQFLKNHTETLKSIYFDVDPLDFLTILSAVPNIRSLEWAWLNGSKVDEARVAEVKLEKLENLKLRIYGIGDNVNNVSFWLFSQPLRLQSFYLNKCVEGFRTIVPFLQSQEHLQKLRILAFSFDDLLDDLEVASSMKFRAKVIHLEQFDRKFLRTPFLSSFLITQKCSLKKLTLDTFLLLDKDVDVLMGLCSLSKLTLSGCIFKAPGDSTVINESIESLRIKMKRNQYPTTIQRQIDEDSEKVIEKLLRSCQAVEALKLIDFKIPRQVLRTIASVRTLRDLSLYSCWFTDSTSLNFPSVKIVTIKENKNTLVIRQHTTRNQQMVSTLQYLPGGYVRDDSDEEFL